MKLNSTVALTLVLLALMLTAGLVSVFFGIAVGREALKGITQPDTRRTNRPATSRKPNTPQENLVLLKEEEIIAKVKVRINGTGKQGRNSPKSEPSPDQSTATTSSNPGQFPFVSQNQGVMLEVRSVARQGENLILNVNMRNSGKEPVRFLYNLLKITDDQGQELSASTDGLPAELPSESENFPGTISISSTAVESAKTISLSLTDYPDQQLKLQVSNIPIAH
jgi:hypothetical protein